MKLALTLLLGTCTLGASTCVGAQPMLGPAPPPQDPVALGDEFTDPARLGQWTRFDRAGGWPDRFQRLEVDAAGDGSLWIEPGTSGWYADFHGALISKRMHGDFDVTVRLKTSGKVEAVPTRAWSLAGLMVREPRAVTPADWTSASPPTPTGTAPRRSGTTRPASIPPLSRMARRICGCRSTTSASRRRRGRPTSRRTGSPISR